MENFQFLIVFILIGIAHWAAHILQCRSCRGWLNGGITFAADGALKTFGWPLALLAYIRDMLFPRPFEGLPFEEVPPGEAQFLVQNKGETLDEFMARAKAKMEELKKAREAK